METETGAEYISETHVRHIMRYVQARDWLTFKPMLILDAACGTGYGTKILAQTNPYVIGIDFNEPALEEASKSRPANTGFMQADLLDARFTADAIVSIETVEHFFAEDGKKLVNNFHRWLSKKGVLIISTPYCDKSGPSSVTKQHLCEYSLTDFEQLLHEGGFAIDQMKITRHDGQAGRRGYCMARAIKT